MKLILRLKIVVVLLGCQFLSYSQSLPIEWEGKWQGVVNIWSYNEKIDSFLMSLEINREDTTWSFIINYHRDKNKPDERKYKLVVVDQGKQQFAIDEQNSILLDTYLNDNCLHTKFGGLGSELLTRMCLSNQVLEYEITSSNAEPVRISGNNVIEKDTIPEIKSYDVYHFMKAKLKKKTR